MDDAAAPLLSSNAERLTVARAPDAVAILDFECEPFSFRLPFECFVRWPDAPVMSLGLDPANR